MQKTMIAERELMERGLQDQHDLLRVTLQSIADAVVTTDAAGCVEMLNPTAEAMVGWTSEESAGRPVEEVIELRERRNEGRPQSSAYAAIRGGVRIDKTDQYVLLSRDGRRMGIEISASPIRNAAGSMRGSVMVFHDVSQARQMADRMSYQAHHDALTGLPNRILLVDRLEQGTRMADRNKDRLVVMFLDLDNFKEINDSLGSALGDELLKEASFRLREALRESDTVCRLGGDEFVVMLPGVKSGEDIEAVAAKLVSQFARPVQVSGQSIEVQCSLGVSVYPQDGSDVGTLMRLADGAMHEAKHGGRNRYAFARAGIEPVELAENSEAPDPKEFYR
jgi:diguanylate cyclase (GGDEF)-like protein/PAS domain S-box-containing protein